MKLRKIVLSSAILLAVFSSFGFKANTSMYFLASYIDPWNSSACYDGPTDDWCSKYNTGSQCTVYAPYTQTYEPAYEYQVPAQNPGSCVIPLYYPW